MRVVCGVVAWCHGGGEVVGLQLCSAHGAAMRWPRTVGKWLVNFCYLINARPCTAQFIPVRSRPVVASAQGVGATPPTRLCPSRSGSTVGTVQAPSHAQRAPACCAYHRHRSKHNLQFFGGVTYKRIKILTWQCSFVVQFIAVIPVPVVEHCRNFVAHSCLPVPIRWQQLPADRGWMTTLMVAVRLDKRRQCRRRCW